jgi:hypothetical protein
MCIALAVSFLFALRHPGRQAYVSAVVLTPEGAEEPVTDAGR